jgi:cytoskeletal protein CcmA (bactofilin family)
MFGRKKGPALNKIDTLLGPNIVLEGNDLKYSGTIKIMGQVHGNITPESDKDTTAIITEHARIVGNLTADHVVIDGRFDGHLIARKSLQVCQHARITGIVEYDTLEVKTGGQLRAKLKVYSDEEMVTVDALLAIDQDGD